MTAGPASSFRTNEVHLVINNIISVSEVEKVCSTQRNRLVYLDTKSQIYTFQLNSILLKLGVYDVRVVDERMCACVCVQAS